jgi:hypothetical protein
MIHFRCRIGLCLGLTLGATAGALRSQVAVSPIHFGVIGGTTIPVGDFRNFANTGWNAGVLLTVSVPLVPISFRIDGQWQQLSGRVMHASDGEPDDQTNFRLIDGTANAVYTFGSVLPVKFYLIGGGGVYYGRARDDAFPHTESATKFGVNGGAGVKLQLIGFAAFVEARYHYIVHGEELLSHVGGSGSGGLSIVPISAGIVF